MPRHTLRSNFWSSKKVGVEVHSDALEACFGFKAKLLTMLPVKSGYSTSKKQHWLLQNKAEKNLQFFPALRSFFCRCLVAVVLLPAAVASSRSWLSIQATQSGHNIIDFADFANALHAFYMHDLGMFVFLLRCACFSVKLTRKTSQ